MLYIIKQTHYSPLQQIKNHTITLLHRYQRILFFQYLKFQEINNNINLNTTMRKNSLTKTITNSKVYAVQSRSNPSGVFPKKVEGKDVLASTVKSNFVNTVMDLKNRQTNKSTEEQYIGGLQQQIKFLQYQLKLLKDKQQYERQGVHELDNFLKDEIPINENILAMKNKYNNTKMSLEAQYKKLIAQESEGRKVLAIQKEEVNRLNNQIQNQISQSKDRQMQFKDKISSLSEDMTRLQSEYQFYLEDTKKKQEEVKKMNEQIQEINRQNQKQKIAQIRKDDQSMKKIFKMIGDFMQNQQQFIKSIMKIEQLAAYDDKNPLVTPLQDQNISLKKRLMINQKQKNTHQNRISEIELFLDERSRDREIQRQQKQKMLNKIFDIKNEINTIERDIDDLVKVQLNQHKSYKIKSLNTNIDQKKRLVLFFNDRLRKLQQQCQNLIQDKKQLTSNLEYERQTMKQKKQKTTDLSNKLLNFKSSIQGIKKYKQVIEKQITPLKTQTQRINMRIPLVEKDIAKKKQELQYMAKQVQLVKELRSLNLEEMKMVATGGNQIQSSLANFIKKWEKIKTSSKPI